MNLLLLVNDEGVKYYCLNRNMSRLLMHTTTSANNQVFLCNYCLQRSRDNTDREMARKLLKENEILCTPHGAQNVELPTGKYSHTDFKAVSYTHLDVYKRQPAVRSCVFFFRLGPYEFVI